MKGKAAICRISPLQVRISMILALVLCMLVLGDAIARQDFPRNIILIGWDGAQRNHLKEMIARGEVPNLIALAKEGTMVDIDITTGATDTKAGWTQILTGYVPEITGVLSNSRYRPIPTGYTVFERLEKFFGPEDIVTAAIVGKKGNIDADGPVQVPYDRWARRMKMRGRKAPEPHQGKKVRNGGRIEKRGDRFLVAFPGKPYYYTRDSMDLFVNGLSKNEKVGKTAIENLEKFRNRRFFFFVHFAEPDHSGHKHGENSLEYTEGIRSDDVWTGRIMAKLKELGIYRETLVYVTADHGFDEGKKSHSYAPFVFLASNDSNIMRAGDRADIAPTILKRFGVDIDHISPPLNGVPLDEPAPICKAPREPWRGYPRWR